MSSTFFKFFKKLSIFNPPTGSAPDSLVRISPRNPFVNTFFPHFSSFFTFLMFPIRCAYLPIPHLYPRRWRKPFLPAYNAKRRVDPRLFSQKNRLKLLSTQGQIHGFGQFFEIRHQGTGFFHCIVLSKGNEIIILPHQQFPKILCPGR